MAAPAELLVLFLDMDAFFVSVDQMDRVSWWGRGPWLHGSDSLQCTQFMASGAAARLLRAV